jgi:hypothetical protein
MADLRENRVKTGINDEQSELRGSIVLNRLNGRMFSVNLNQDKISK